MNKVYKIENKPSKEGKIKMPMQWAARMHFKGRNETTCGKGS